MLVVWVLFFLLLVVGCWLLLVFGGGCYGDWGVKRGGWEWEFDMENIFLSL